MTVVTDNTRTRVVPSHCEGVLSVTSKVSELCFRLCPRVQYMFTLDGVLCTLNVFLAPHCCRQHTLGCTCCALHRYTDFTDIHCCGRSACDCVRHCHGIGGHHLLFLPPTSSPRKEASWPQAAFS